MKRISLSEHIEQSKIAAEANRRKGNRHGSILSMLYADPVHFIEELIQNAEDALARRSEIIEPGMVKVVVDDDGIDFFHNGDPFSEADLMAITTFASTTKKNSTDINMIGKFGIGFRSVFGICDEPEIHSGRFHFRIRDYEVLHETGPVHTAGFSTLIRLQWSPNLSMQARNSIRQRLLETDPRFMLFVHQIVQFEIVTPQQHLVHSCSEIAESKPSVKVIHSDTGFSITEQHYVMMKDSGKLSIALRYQPDERLFLNEPDTNVRVYFSTRQSFDAGFLMHGHFTTTPNRESIPFSDEWTPENIKLLSRTSQLVFHLLQQLRRADMLWPSVFRLFSWGHHASDHLTKAIMDGMHRFLAEEKCLPAEGKSWMELKQLCIPDRDELYDLLNAKDLSEVYGRIGFPQKNYLTDASFVGYLKTVHKVKTADIETLAFYIKNHPNFLKNRKTEWFIHFFTAISSESRLWDELHKDRYYSIRSSPIIPDSRKVLHPPYSLKGHPGIFIGQAGAGIPTVHPDLIHHATCMNFFSMLGLPLIDPIQAEAEKLLSSFKTQQVNAWWFRLFEICRNASESMRQGIRSKMADIECVPVRLSGKSETRYVKPSEAYVRNSSLETFFNNQSVNFVSESLYRYFSTRVTEQTGLEHFLQSSGVNSYPRKIVCTGEIPNEELDAMRNRCDLQPIVKERVFDTDLDGLTEFLEHPDPKKSAALWHMLSQLPEAFFSGSVVYESWIRSETMPLVPTFLRKLRESKWLYDRSLMLLSPNEARIQNLHDMYRPAFPESLRWAEMLGIQHEKASVEALHLLSLLQQHGIGHEKLLHLIQKEQMNPTWVDGNPDGVLTNLPSNKIEAGQMSMPDILFSFEQKNSESWGKYLTGKLSETIRKHLLSSRFHSSPDIVVEQQLDGYLVVKSKAMVLQHVFAGLWPADELPVYFNPHLFELLKDFGGRKDLLLCVFHVRDHLISTYEGMAAHRFLHDHTLLILESKSLKV